MSISELITPDEWYEVLRDHLEKQHGEKLNPEEEARVRDAAAKMSELAEKRRTRKE